MSYSRKSSEQDGEREVLAGIRGELAWETVERFARLRRHSGSDDERQAAAFLAEQLHAFGVPVTLLEPELLLSEPLTAALRVEGAEGGVRDFRCKSPAFSASTEPGEVVGTVVPLPPQRLTTLDQIFADRAGAPDVRGKIVLTDAQFMPIKVRYFQALGAIGQIYVKRGPELPDQGASCVWGSPTPSTLADKPRTPVLCVTQPDGEELFARCRQGPLTARLRTHLNERWTRCPLVVATIAGRSSDFLLAHAHLDSWHYGVGDNATGDAALLELARLLYAERGRLRRSLRVAWWPGHFTGHYGGSTFYADHFAGELDQSCVAHMYADSPGCQGATDYTEAVSWCAEAGPLCEGAIRDAVGSPAKGRRPIYTSDYSFSQIGITGLYQLLSWIPAEERRRRGYTHYVGGCGGNPVWHTEADTLATADPTVLARDIRIYALTALRTLGDRVLPFEHELARAEIQEHLTSYHDQAAGAVDLAPAIEEARALAGPLAELSRCAAAVRSASDADGRELAARAESIDAAIRGVARHLVPLSHARGERFDHDLHLSMPPVPRLEPARHLGAVALSGSPLHRLLTTQLVRERNKVVAILAAARRELSWRLADLGRL